MSLSTAEKTRLCKAAEDNGFDLALSEGDGWFSFSSTKTSLRIWLSVDRPNCFVCAYSRKNIHDELGDYGEKYDNELPQGAVAARSVSELSKLHPLLRRAFQLSRALPNTLLDEFKTQTVSMPQATEVERLVVQRVGQDIFRRGLLDYWEGRCAVTSLEISDLLRASHIKPWKDCETDSERLDIFNGLLLAPHIDALFDRGLLTFLDDGLVEFAKSVDVADLQRLGLARGLRLVRVSDNHKEYLNFHRTNVFRG